MAGRKAATLLIVISETARKRARAWVYRSASGKSGAEERAYAQGYDAALAAASLLADGPPTLTPEELAFGEKVMSRLRDEKGGDHGDKKQPR